MTQKKLHPSYKQGCRQHAYFPPSAADHGLHGVSLLPPANYVHMRSVIPDVREVADPKIKQVLQQKSIHLVPVTYKRCHMPTVFASGKPE